MKSCERDGASTRNFSAEKYPCEARYYWGPDLISHPRGSDSGPPLYESGALPTELGWRKFNLNDFKPCDNKTCGELNYPKPHIAYC